MTVWGGVERGLELELRFKWRGRLLHDSCPGGKHWCCSSVIRHDRSPSLERSRGCVHLYQSLDF